MKISIAAKNGLVPTIVPDAVRHAPIVTIRPFMGGDVVAARRTERISISSPKDFRLERNAPLAREDAVRDNLLPYCLDFVRRRSVYVGGVDSRAAQTAPFYYLYLRREAKRVVSAPWEAGALHTGAARMPIFLFSPGRCGSTLLSRILSAAGAANVSEPDFYTQATSAVCASRLNPLRTTIQRAIWNIGADLSEALDAKQVPVVKLRAESCRAPDLLLHKALERRTIFLTRGFEDWARSNGKAFRNGPRKSVTKYLRAMTCYAWLKQNSDCHLLRYETLSADPLGATQALAQFLERDIAAEAVMSTMKEDSQGGTPLRQGARPDLAGWEKRYDATLALWNSDRIRRARERLGVEELATG